MNGYMAIGKILRRMAVVMGLVIIGLLFVGIASAAPPIVTVLPSNGGEIWSGTRDITWNATDPDGDYLSITIRYSADGGGNWTTIIEDISNDGVFSWITGYVPDGSDYLIKVIASDGTLTGEDQSDVPFEINNPIDMMINEIYYNTSGNNLENEFIELYVYDDGGNLSELNTSGWSITTYDAEGDITLPYISNLDDFDYIVIHMGPGTNDTDASDGIATIYLNLTSPILDNAGDEVGLYNSSGAIYDFVRYEGGNGDPVLENWQPSDLGIYANTTYESLQVHGPDLDSSSNWVSAPTSKGSPNVYEFLAFEATGLKAMIYNGISVTGIDSIGLKKLEANISVTNTTPVNKSILDEIRNDTKDILEFYINEGFNQPENGTDGYINITVGVNTSKTYEGETSKNGDVGLTLPNGTKVNHVVKKQVLAHELMHTIQAKNFTDAKGTYTKWNPDKVVGQNYTFLDEGMAEYWGIEATKKNFNISDEQVWDNLTKEIGQRLENFTNTPDVNIFTDWPGDWGSYVGAYLFIKYKADKYNQSRLVNLHNKTKNYGNWRTEDANDTVGPRAIDAEYGSGSFLNNFIEWIDWNYLDHLGIDKDGNQKEYYKNITVPCPKLTWNVTFNGTKINKSDSVSLWGTDYININLHTTNVTRITFNGSSNGSFVVKKEKFKKSGGFEETVYRNVTNISEMICPCNYTNIVLKIARINGTNGNYTVTIEGLPTVPGIEVEKKVWNGTAWAESIEAKVCDTVKFKLWVHNNGTTCCNIANITVTDTLPDSLKLSNITMQVHPETECNLTSNPDGTTTLKWFFNDTILKPCENITIIFWAHVIKCGVDINVVNATGVCGNITVSDEDTASVNAPGLTAEQPRNVTAVEDDDYTIEGTATGVDDVDIVLIGPEGYYPIYDPLLNVLNGLAITSTPVTDNEFSEDITMTEGVDIGRWKIMVFSPGLDGEYGDLSVGAGELAEIPTTWFVGKTQDQIVAILKDHTVNVAGSDDLLVSLTFEVETPYVNLNPIEPVAVGEPLYVSGTTNREPETMIVILTFGPVELCPMSTMVEWPTPDEGVFSTTIDTSGAVPATYRVKADDGDGHTDTAIVEIGEAVPQRHLSR